VEIRHDWRATKSIASIIFRLPDLIFQAQLAHRAFHKPDEIQLCRLLSIKTGGCPEDCAYCSQSAHYRTGVAREELMSPAAVREAANHAKKGRRDTILHGGRVAPGFGRRPFRSRA